MSNRRLVLRFRRSLLGLLSALGALAVLGGLAVQAAAAPPSERIVPRFIAAIGMTAGAPMATQMEVEALSAGWMPMEEPKVSLPAMDNAPSQAQAEELDADVVAASQPASGAPLAVLPQSARLVSVPRVVNDPARAVSRVFLQSVSAQPSAVTLVSYDPQGRELRRQRFSLAPFAARTLPAAELLPAGSTEAAVTITSEGELTVGVEETLPNGRVVSYDAVHELSNTAAFPIVGKRGAGSTMLILQNVSDRAAEVRLTFVGESGAPVTAAPIALAPFGSRTLSLAEVAELPATFTGTALARAQQAAIAGVAVDLGMPSPIAYSGFGFGVERLRLPSAAGAAGAQSRLLVQHLGEGASEASVARVKRNDNSPAPPAGERRPLQARGGAALAEPAASGAPAGLEVSGPAGAQLVALLELDGLPVKIVPPAHGTAVVPQARAATTLAIQNLSGDPALVGVQLVGADGSRVASQIWELEPGESVRQVLGQLSGAGSFTGTAVIVANQPVGVIAR